LYKRDHTGRAKYDVKKLQKPSIAKEYAERIKANLHDKKQKDGENRYIWTVCKQALTQAANEFLLKKKAVPLHAMEALGGRGGIAPTHSRPRY
jgi:hypothetical protein